MERARQILRSVFGYDDFRHRQSDIIQTLLDGQDALVLMPTGGGKSLCYQIPALVRDGVGVVVSPLIALMQDQVDALTQVGVRAAFLNSTQDTGTQRAVEQALLNGELDLLYVAPERLLMVRMLDLLDRSQVALFAIDEAHCVSQWGHDFRREYQQLKVLHERFPGIPRIALTATADQRTREEIVAQLDLDMAARFVHSFDRPNIRYTISEGNSPRDRLWRFIDREHAGAAGIVYCLSRNKVEQVADWLCGKGRVALPYHAGLPEHVRRENQARFLREEGVIIVATIAFGMGIDKPDVRFVAHLNVPKSLEAYYQETGRAGRDGQPAHAWMAYNLQDVISLRRMMSESDADEQFKRIAYHKLDTMLGLCELTTCRRQTLLSYFGETRDEPCGNCDICLHPPVTWDGTEAAQKALSCVYRTGQRFGVNYVVDVLTGKEDARIQSNHHDRLSTFGIGAEFKATQWRNIVRQLIAQGYLDVDVDGHGSMHLTQAARPLLRGETSVQLRELPAREKKSKSRLPRQPVSDLNPADRELFEALRLRRLELAREQSVPPYVIFHDSTLREMACSRPLNENAMGAIAGIGEKKLERFGKEFIAVIQAQS
ncbi:DNA helicase RecQ [Pseudomonadota bacterium]